MKLTRIADKTVAAITALFLTGSLAGCEAAAHAFEAATSTPSAQGEGMTVVDAATALKQLDGIPVKGRAPKTGYTRDEFGPAWSDTDHNGCDTRNDILARDLTNESFKPGTNNCVVAAGTLADKYTGTTIEFIRGQDTSNAVQIDHIVPLSDAWQKGAQQLSEEQREELPTTRSTSWPQMGPLTALRATRMRPHGCHRTGPSVASTLPVKLP